VFCPFIGKILIGCDQAMRLYDFGKKRLLRKCEIKVPSSIHLMDTKGARIFAGTALNSVILYVYRLKENQLQCFADDTVSRPLSAMCVLDYETVFIADKLGCISVLRVPDGLSEALEKDPAGLASAARETLFAAPHKLDRQCEYTLGGIVTGLSKCSLYIGARPAILYTCIDGSIGMFIPLQYKSTVTLLQSLESELRSLMNDKDSLPECSLTGRHQLLRRSQSGQAVKAVIDGMFCYEGFSALPNELKLKVTGALDKDPSEIVRTIRDCMHMI
jgi:splicing factor 3B subunit 3